MSRRGSGQQGSSRGRPRRIPQFPQPKTPSPPPATPFQPGASPSAPLPIPAVAFGVGALLLGELLKWLNQRPEQPPGRWGGPDAINFGPTDGTITIVGSYIQSPHPWFDPVSGAPTGQSYAGDSNPINTSGSGRGVQFGALSGTIAYVPTGSSGTGLVQAEAVLLRGASPSGVLALGAISGSRTGGLGGGVGSRSISINITSVSYQGVPQQAPRPPRPAFAPGIAPALPGALPDTTPEQLPAAPPIVPQRAAPPVPATAPRAPTPGPAPGGSPGTAPGSAPGRAPAPAQTPAPARPLAPPQALPINAEGLAPQPAPAPQITPPGDTFIPGLPPIRPNGPPATMEGIAGELGKLEQKLEILLAPDGPRSLLDNINRVIDQVENIRFVLETLFPPEPYTFPPGSYQLAPVCDRDSAGELIDPLPAPWAGGEGEFAEIRQRLDALALLIQHHKTLKQPTCGPRGSGPHSNVTVHFESD